jgi:hypothetical protein
MATAKDIFKRSLRLLQVLDAGEEPTAQEAEDCLTALNAMLDIWSVQRLYVYSINEETLSWAGSAQSRTIGSGGNFSTTRPTKIEPSTFFTTGGNDYSIMLLDTFESYTAISDKSTESTIPEYLYYNAAHPLGVLYIWPVPPATLSLKLHSTSQLSSLAATTTTFSMPPGYEDAVSFSLAERLAPEFGVAVPPEVVKTGAANRRAIKRLNTPTPVSSIEVGRVGAGYRYNVNTDRA